MTDQPQTPSTEAGKALREHRCWQADPDASVADWEQQVDRAIAAGPCQNCADRREREAVLYRVIADKDRQVAALRSALERVRRDWNEMDPAFSRDEVDRVLSDLPSAATEYEARIRAEAVKPWREALAHDYAFSGHASYCAEPPAPCSCGYGAVSDAVKALLSDGERGN